MTILSGHRVAVIGMDSKRPLPRYLASLGAEIVTVDAATDLRLPDVSFLVDGLGLKRLHELGLTREKIAAINPALIHVSVSYFGSYGPNAGLLGSEIVASAMSGTLRLTGDADRPPVKEALNACTFHAEMVAAAGTMALHFNRARTGMGDHVDVSVQEVAFNRNVSSILSWQFDKRKLKRVGGAINYGKTSSRCIWPLADGWCFHSLMTGRFGAPANQALSDWMDEAGVSNPLRGVDWLSYNRTALDAGLRVVWETAIEAFFRTRTKHDLLTEGRRRGINASVTAEPADVLADPHLQARDFWTRQADLNLPGRFVTLHPGKVPGRTEIPKSTRKGPLSGIRVLDFSWALVGSVTTKTLGDLGADIIKVESRTRPCLSRIDVQVAASTAGNFDDKPWFAHLNSSKRSLSLDMKRPEAMEILGPLIEWADVVVENFSPGTMKKLGLDYASIVARNPGIVMVSGSVYGQTGPLAQEWGVDGTGAALSGRTFLTGWPDRDPVIPGSVPYGDVIVPFVMAGTVCAVLAQRSISGTGAHIDASMYEICVQQMFDAFVDTQSGATPQRSGNASSQWYRQEVWPAAGDDRWIAVSIQDEAQWQQLCTMASGEDIAAWTSTQADYDLMQLLQKAGIAAGVVQDIEDTVERDAGLTARGALVELPYAFLGSFGHVRTPMQFAQTTTSAFHAPGIGEHNAEIATTIAKLSEARVAELETLGVFK